MSEPELTIASQMKEHAMPTPPKTPVPAAIQKALKQWRAGHIDMPPSFIAFHKQLAEIRLAALVTEFGIRVVETTMRDAGWFDGMSELNAIVESQHRALHTLVWSDANQDFMVRMPSGGQGALHAATLFGPRS